MPENNVVVSQIVIKVGGTELSEEQMNSLISVEVDQHSHLPHMFTVRMYDPALEFLDNGPFDLTKEVEITAEAPESNETYQLIKGEITALEPEFMAGGVAKLVIRGYDKMHRLFRETKSKSFLNIKDSDIASQIAGNVGLSPQVESTSTVYDHIYQDNQTDLAFLMQRAWRIGFECFAEEGKLYFRKPPSSGSGPTLKWEEDLISFSPRVTLAEQVNEVLVKGWDVEKQAAIVGQAGSGALYPQTGESKNGAKWAATFGTGKVVFVDHPVVSQAEADIIAKARLDELSGVFVEAEGTAYRHPDVTAGKMVTLEGLGTRLSGTYLVTQARHRYDQNGYRVDFSVRGLRTGQLAEQFAQSDPVQRWPGVVTAVVTNTDDPKNWGRVKVKFPWMADDVESAWARVIGIGAGPEAGYYVMPEVGDEVIVTFEYGDINHPILLGGTWNGKAAIPAEAAGVAQGEKPLVRTWHSRTGHYMAMYDSTNNKADNKVEITTAAGHSATLDDANKKVEVITTGGHTVTMDDQGKSITIKSSGGHEVTLDDNGRKIIIKSAGDVEMKSTTNMKIEAGANLEIKATGNLDIKANGITNIQTSAIMNIKGSLLNLN